MDFALRIEASQIRQIHDVIMTRWKQIPYRLYLYGSRVHDHLKGGDIDLLLVTTQEGVELFNQIELTLLVEIKKQPDIGQRRIDLKAATQADLQKVPFLQEISRDMVELKVR
jgi:hypothetical protein